MSKKNNIEEMMKQATQESNDEIVDKKKTSNKFTSKQLVTIVGVVIVAVIAVFLLLSFRWKTATGGKDKVIYEGDIKEVQTLTERATYPVEIPRWARDPFYDDEFFEDEKRVKEMIEWVENTGFDVYLISEVSPKDDFADDVEITNDINKEFLEDGTENPNFVYVLREDYMKAFALTTQRLLNPNFGHWTEHQYAVEDGEKTAKEYVDMAAFDDIFVEEWWTTQKSKAINDKDYSIVPIFADWNNDDYGGLEFMEYKAGDVNPGRFFGIIDESPERMMSAEQHEVVDEENIEINVFYEVKVPVKYVAFGKADTLIEKTGWLEFELHPNYDNPEDVNYRVLASNVELKMD